MIASTRFMPLPPFGYALQTYWTFRSQNQPLGQIVEIERESILTGCSRVQIKDFFHHLKSLLTFAALLGTAELGHRGVEDLIDHSLG
jgi:hypothetical protein